MAFKMKKPMFKLKDEPTADDKTKMFKLKDEPTAANKTKMQKLMEQFKKATDPQDKLRIKNQMEKLAGM